LTTIICEAWASFFFDELYSRIQKNQSVLLLGKLEIGKRRADLAASNLSLSIGKLAIQILVVIGRVEAIGCLKVVCGCFVYFQLNSFNGFVEKIFSSTIYIVFGFCVVG
jgi:hypothetical protein